MSGIVVDKDAFFRRMKTLYDAWKVSGFFVSLALLCTRGMSHNTSHVMQMCINEGEALKGGGGPGLLFILKKF